jgi:hypothetical protein
MKMKQNSWQERIGKAYRCKDGVIRWVIGLSQRGFYQMLWLDEERQIWFSAGIIKAKNWSYLEVAGEFPAPQPGDTYKQAGPTGIVTEHTIPFPANQITEGEQQSL